MQMERSFHYIIHHGMLRRDQQFTQSGTEKVLPSPKLWEEELHSLKH